MLWPLSVVLVANELTNGRLAIPALAGLLVYDLERPLTWFSRSRHSLTQNISQTATDTAIGRAYYGRRIGNRTQTFEWH